MQHSLLNGRGGPLEPANGAGGGPFGYASEPMAYWTVPADDSRATDSGSLVCYWRVLSRHKAALVWMSLLFGLGAYLLTSVQTPVYQVKTLLEVQNVNENFMNMRDLNPTAAGSAVYSPDSELQTQTKILESRPLLDRVLGQENLEKRLIAAGQSNRLRMWLKDFGLADDQDIPDHEAIASRAAASMKVRTQPNTRIIELTFDSTNPQLAADFANRMSAEFIEFNLEERWKSTQHTGEWLTRQMQALKVKLEKSEGELLKYARKSNLVFTSDKDNVAEDRLRQLQQELLKAQADRVTRQSTYELLAKGNAEVMPEVLDDSTLKEYQVELTRLRRQLAELSSAFTSEYPKVSKLKAQITAVETAIERKRNSILRRLHNDFDAAQRREQLLAGNYAAQVSLMSDQGGKIAHYNILKREVETTRQLYESMLQRVKEAAVASALRASNIHVIDPARRPRAPYKPSVVLNTAFGGFSGLLAAIMLVLVRERSNSKIFAPGDTGQYLNVPELGVIPTTKPARSSAALSLGPANKEAAAGRLELRTWQQPLSPLAEAFRVTLTSILFSGQNGAHPRVIAVSSATINEGKTTVASNLAIALSQAGQRVLLIDGDMRRPRVHGIFDLDNRTGLSDVLAGTSPLEIRQTKAPNLFVLSSGSRSDANLLFGPRLGELVRRLRAEFDMILFDTPPLLQMPDARILGRHTDGVVLVVRAEKTSRDGARLALARLQEDGIPVLGTILTDWNPKSSGQYAYYNYSSDHYHRTGATG